MRVRSWKTYLGRPENDWGRRNAMSTLGIGLSVAKQYADALVVREAELAMERRFGAPEVDILVALANLANTYEALERPEEALGLRGNYCQALYRGESATLDDIREAVTILEDLAPSARRVLGSAYPLAISIETTLRDARATLSARETPSPGSA